MSLILRTQLIEAFLGDQEDIHGLTLPDVFSSGGSKNLWVNQYGRAKKIDGYSKQNSSAVTTDTGTSTTMVRALFPYKGTEGGSVARTLLGVFDDTVNEIELYKSTDDGSNWTFVFDWGSTVVGQVPDFAQFGDDLYITTGKTVPKKWDNSTLATAGRTQSPTPTSALSSSAGTLSGTYTYKLLSLVLGARQAGSASATELSVEDLQVTLTWTADTNTNVTGYEIYRTSGSGKSFYLVDYVDGRTTSSYTDNTPDRTILEHRLMEEHGDAPPTTYFCETHKSRMWWGRQDANPTRAYFSDFGLAEDVLSDNFLDFKDSQTVGDVMTGMLGNVNGRLVVFTEQSIWTVSGTGAVTGITIDWSRKRSKAQIGCVSHRTAVQLPKGARYTDQTGLFRVLPESTVAYLTPLGDIRIWDGDNDPVISHAKKSTLESINYNGRANSYAMHDVSRSEATWVFATGSNVDPDTAVTWNYRWGIWYTREWPFGHITYSENSTTASLVIGGSRATTTGGFVYKLWDGDDFDGVSIEAVLMTKPLYGRDDNDLKAMSHTKRFRWCDFLFETKQTIALTIEWLSRDATDDAAALGSSTLTPSAVTVLSSDGDTIVSTEPADLLVSSLSSSLRVVLKDSNGNYVHDQGIRLRIGDNAATGSWSLEGLNLAYQILPGLQRRMP